MPQTKPIMHFTGTHAYLSNFYIEPDGTHVEGEFQAAKCVHPIDAVHILTLTPGNAKRYGGRVTLKTEWELVKIGIMWNLVRQKFMDHDYLLKLLLATGDAELIEGNTWNDKFWGKVCKSTNPLDILLEVGSVEQWVGENHLGKILMKVREEFNT